MGKLAVPTLSLTPADQVREQLDGLERALVNLHGMGARATDLLLTLDAVSVQLEELGTGESDVRAEQARFEGVVLALHKQKRRFLREARGTLQQRRRALLPPRDHTWWYLDETLRRERQRSLRRLILGAVAVTVALGILWFVYDRFLAPPPHIRQANRQAMIAEQLVSEGDLAGAESFYREAAHLDPADPDYPLWLSIIYSRTGSADLAAEQAGIARDLAGSDVQFHLSRGFALLALGDLDGAQQDADAVLAAEPDRAYGYYLQGEVAVARGDLDAARSNMEQAAELARENGDTYLEGMARARLALILSSPPQASPEP